MKKAILFLGFCIILTSCHHTYYVSSIQNVPLFREKNEFHLAGSYAIGDESESGELQTAYSITNYLGIMANVMKTKTGNFEKMDYVSGLNYDFGIGFFRPIGSKAVFEVYSGYGRNRQHHEYSTSQYNSATGTDEFYSDGDAWLKYRRIYFQPSFGLATDHFDVAASVRLNQLWYTYINSDVVDHPEDIQILNMLNDRNHYMLEPAITLRTGWRYFKVQFQASYAKYLNNLDDEDEFYDFVEGPHISCGLYLTLSNRWNKTK
jgi:hypothetical protein